MKNEKTYREFKEENEKTKKEKLLNDLALRFKGNNSGRVILNIPKSIYIKE